MRADRRPGDVLRAVRSQQRAGGGFEVVLVLYGVPDWAAVPASGCERSGLTARSRPITAAGLRGYRALVRARCSRSGAARTSRCAGGAPWNEPNGPFFLSPQRRALRHRGALRAPVVYAALYRALRDELRVAGGDRRLVLGDLADVVTRRPQVSSAREVLAALPRDVVCSAAVVAQHAYAEVGRAAAAAGVVGAVERVLDRRGCARRTPIWVTETGVGGTHAGERRRGGAAARRADCRALQDDLRRWWADPRVTAAFQYTVRDDPAFPVGLADSRLRRAWPAYDLLRAWGGERAPEAPPPPDACAGGG